MATTLEELQILITSETSELRRELNRVRDELNGVDRAVNKSTSGITKAFKTAAVAIAGVIAINAIGKYVKDSVMAASELEGALLGLQSIVEGQGRSFSKANQFINEYIADGLVPLTNAVTAYKNLAARGYNDEQIQQVMNRLKDAAAFGRQASYTLGDAVSSATEGLKNENSILVDNAGVTKNVAKMWDEYAKSIGKNAQQLTQQEKIQAEVNGIMQETQYQVGDAAKYTDTFAGRLAALNKTLGDIQVNIGQAFMPIANTVLPLLQKLANWLAKVTLYIKYFMQAFFGVSASQKQANATVGGGISAQESYGKAAEKAGEKVKKAADKAKRSVAGFDEINALSKPAKNAGDAGEDGGIGAIDGIADLEMPEIDTETIPAKIQEMADKVKSIFSDISNGAKGLGLSFADAFSGIGPALQPLYDAVDPIRQSLREMGETFLQLNEEFLKPAANYILFDFIPSIVTGFVQDFAPVFADVAVWSVDLLARTFQNATDIMVELWNSTWLPSLEKLKGAWLGMSSSVAKSLQTLLDGTIKPLVDYVLNDFILPIFKRINEVLVPILTDVLVFAFKEVAKTFEWAANLMNDIYKSVIQPVFELLKKIVMDTLKIVEDLWKKHGSTLIKNVSDLLQNIRDLFQQLWDKVLKPIIQPFLEMLNWLWDKHLKALVKEVGDFIMKLVNGALEIFNKFIKPIVSYLIDLLAPTFTRIFKLVVDVVGTAIGAIADVIKGLLKILGGLIDFIVGVFTGNWKKAWEGVKSIFKGVFDSLWGIVKFPLNLIIDGINFVIGALSSISIDIPDWVPKYGGQTFGINIPKIPKLARGGIVDRETMFIAGESGEEVVMPLENNTGWITQLAQKVASQMPQAQTTPVAHTSDRPIEVTLQVGQTKLGRAVINSINQLQKQEGRVLLQL